MAEEHEIGDADPRPKQDRRADDMQRFDEEIKIHRPERGWRAHAARKPTREAMKK